jgi:lysyl endopeptidase
VAFNNGTPLYRISHPKGAPQAFSRHSVDTAAGTCQGLPRGNFIYSRDTLGGTEGGSSGSVVMNSQAQVVGQLLGSCGFDPENACDHVSNATVDGAFAASFAKMKPWLNP